MPNAFTPTTGGAQYAFRVEHRGRLLASGRAAVIHPP